MKEAFPNICRKAQQHPSTNKYTCTNTKGKKWLDVVGYIVAGHSLHIAVKECSGDNYHYAVAIQYAFDQVVLSLLALRQLDQTKPVISVFPSSIPVKMSFIVA